MENQKLLNSIERKFTPFYKGLIIFYSFVLVFISTSFSLKFGSNPYFKPINDFFHTGVINAQFFSVFELLFISILAFSMFKFSIGSRYRSKEAFGVLFFAVIGYVSRMINPNNDTINPVLGLPLFSNINEYSFLFFIYIVLFWKKLEFTFFIKFLIKYIFLFALIRGTIIFISWYFFNTGWVRFGNVNVTLMEPDTLFLFSYLAALSLALYLLYRKKIYIVGSLLFLIIVLFSQQRSTFYPGMIAISFGLLIYYKFNKKIGNLVVSFATILTVIFLTSMSFASLNTNSKINMTIERYLSSIPGYESSTNEKEFTDAGHWEQSNLTVLSIWSESPFWGLGYGNSEEEFLLGQTANIHNAYAGMWYHQGIITLLFYLYVILLLIKKLILVLFNMNKENYELFYIKSITLLYLVGYSFTAYFSPEGIFTEIRSQMLWLFLLAFILKVDYYSYYSVFGRIKSPSLGVGKDIE